MPILANFANRQHRDMTLRPKGFIQGANIYLRDLRMKDVSGPYSWWLNDSDVCRFNQHARFPISKKELKDYVRSSKHESSRIVFAIDERKTHQHIGNVSLQNMNFIERSAELAIIIGEKDFWGKGIGFEAWTLAMQYGFEVLNLHRIYCGIVDQNTGMVKIAKKSGMKQEGLQREAFYKHGQYYNVVTFGILRSDYEKNSSSSS